MTYIVSRSKDTDTDMYLKMYVMYCFYALLVIFPLSAFLSIGGFASQCTVPEIKDYFKARHTWIGILCAIFYI